MGAIGSLFVNVGADIKGFLAGMTKVEATASGLATKLSNFGSTMTKYVTLPMAALGAASIGAAVQVEKGLNAIRIGTGKTGEELAGLQGVMRNVARQSEEDFLTIGTAVAELNTRLGLTGEPLEKMTKLMLDLADVTGMDVKTAIADATRFLYDFGVAVENQESALNYLFRTTQNTGISFDRLSELLVTYGSKLRALGFDFETSAAMLGKFEKEGVNIEKMLAGLGTGLSRMAKEGVTDANRAFMELCARIKNAQSDTEAISYAVETFGSRSAADLAMAIREGRFEFEDLVSTLRAGTDTISDADQATMTLADRFNIFKNNVMLALEPIGTKLMGALEGLLPVFQRVIGAVAGLIGKFGELPSPIQNAILVGAGIVAMIGPITKVIGAVQALGAAFTASAGLIGVAVAAVTAGGVAIYWAYDQWQQAERDFVDSYQRGIDLIVRGNAELEGNLTKAIAAIRSEFERFGVSMTDAQALATDWQAKSLELFDSIVAAGQRMGAELAPVPQDIMTAWRSQIPYFRDAGRLAMISYLQGIIERKGMLPEEARRIAGELVAGLSSQDAGAKEAAKKMLYQYLMGLVEQGQLTLPEASKLAQQIRAVFEPAPKTDWWRTWYQNLVDYFNRVKSAADGAAQSLSNAGAVRGGGGGGWHVPMQHGGIVTRPTLALVGEAGPEAVIPLSRLRGDVAGGLTIAGGSFHFHGVQDVAGFERSLLRVAQQARIRGAVLP